MAKLSDIYAGTKKALSKAAWAIESWARKAVDNAVTVGEDIKRWTFADNIKGAIIDTTKESLDAMESGKDRGITGNIQTGLTKWLYGLGEIVTWVWVPIVWGKTDAGKIQSWAKKLSETFSLTPVAKGTKEFLGEDSKLQKWISAVASVSDIYSNVIGKTGSGIDKFQKDDYVWGALDLWFAALGSMPFLKWIRWFTSGATTTGALWSVWALEYVSENTQTGKDMLRDKLISIGKDESTATRWANNTIDAIDLVSSAISMKYGMKLGGKDTVAKQKGVSPKSISTLDVVKANTANALKAGIADTTPSAVYDFIDQSDADDEVKDTAKTLFSFAVSAAPVGGLWPKKSKTDPAQMKIGDETSTQKLSDKYPKEIEFTPEGYKKKVTGTAITRGNITLAIRELPWWSMEIYDPKSGKFLNAYSQKWDQWNIRVDDAFAMMEWKTQWDIEYKREVDNTPKDLSVWGMNFKLGKDKSGYTLYTTDWIVLQKSKTRWPLVEKLKAMIQKEWLEWVRNRIAQMRVNIDDAVKNWQWLTPEEKQSFAQKAWFRDVDLAIKTIDETPSRYKTIIIDAYLNKQKLPDQSLNGGVVNPVEMKMINTETRDMDIETILKEFNEKSKYFKDSWIKVSQLDIEWNVDDIVKKWKKLNEWWNFVEQRTLWKTQKTYWWYISEPLNQIGWWKTITAIRSDGKWIRVRLPEWFNSIEWTVARDFVMNVIDRNPFIDTEISKVAIKPIQPPITPSKTKEVVRLVDSNNAIENKSRLSDKAPKSDDLVVTKTTDTEWQIKTSNGVLDYQVVDNRMEIDGVQVNKEARRSGVWTRLMKEAESQAQRDGLDTIRLVAVPLEKWTNKSELNAFYTKLWYTKLEWFENVYEKNIGKSNSSETPTPTVSESKKWPLQIAMDNVARYEDYVSGILQSGRMPNGKKLKKSDINFMRAEYKRLVDIMKNVGKTQETELVDLGWWKWTLVRDKVYALPAPRITDAKRAEWAQKEAQFRSAYEAWKIAKEDAAEYARLEKEFQDKIKEEDIAMRNFDFEMKKQNLIDQQRAWKIAKEAQEKRIIAENEYNNFINRMGDEFSDMVRKQEIDSLEFAWYKWEDIPAYLRDNYTKTEDVDQPVQIALDRALLWLKPEKLSDKTQVNDEPTMKEVISGGNKGTPLEKDLNNILNSFSLGGNVFVSRSKNIRNNLWTIGGYLEKGMKKLSDRYVNLRNISQTARNSMPLFANKILESISLDKRNQDFRDFGFTEDMVIGGRTPNGTIDPNTWERWPWLDITDYKQVWWAIGSLVPNDIKNFTWEWKWLSRRALAEYVYMVNKDNPDKLNSIFTLDEIASFKKAETQSRELPKQLAQYLVDIWFLRNTDLAEDYVRYVQSQYGRDMLNEPITVSIGGVDVKFDTIEMAMTSAHARRIAAQSDPSQAKIADEMEARLSSILKEKSNIPQIDYLRSHSPTLQTISYAMEVGRLLQNKATIDNFREFIDKDDKGVPKNNENYKFIQWLFPEKNQSEIINGIVGIKWVDQTKWWRTSEAIGKVTRATTWWIMWGNLWTMVQPILSTVPKAVMLNAKKYIGNLLNTAPEWTKLSDRAGIITWVFDGVTWNIESTVKPAVHEALAAYGFMPDYQPFDTTPSGKVMKWAEWIVAESSGRRLELAAKASYALNDMRNTLLRNGINPWRNAESITKAWQEWASNPKNKEKFLIEQDRIQENLSWMGESTIFNKSMIDGVRKTNFQALTWYANGQVNKILTNIWRLTTIIESTGWQRAQSFWQLAWDLAIWGAISAVAAEYIMSQDPEIDEEAAWNLWNAYANRSIGNAPMLWYGVATGITNSPIWLTLDIATDIISLWTNSILFDLEEWEFEQRLQIIADKLIKSQWGIKTINEATGNAVSEWLADTMGTVSTTEMTRSGKASWQKNEWWREWWERVFWMNTDSALINMMYNNVAKEWVYNYLDSKWIQNWLYRESLASVMTFLNNFRKDITRPLNDAINSISWKEQWMDAAAIYAMWNTYRKLSDDDTLQSYMGKLNIDQNFISLISQEIQALYLTEAKANVKWWQITLQNGNTINLEKDFGKSMEYLEKENPKLFNDIISSMSRMAVESNKAEFEAKKSNVDYIKEKIFKPSTMLDDAVIASIAETNPNSTAVAQAVTNLYQDMVSNTRWWKDTEKALTTLNDIFWTIYQSMPRSSGLERSIAIASTELINNIKETVGEEWVQYLKSLMLKTPYIFEAMRNWLTYRWFRTLNQEQVWTDTSQGAQSTTMKLSDMVQTVTPSTTPSTIWQAVVPPEWDQMKPTWEFWMRIPQPQTQTSTSQNLLRRKKLSEMI